jgi:hypothetical protein
VSSAETLKFGSATPERVVVAGRGVVKPTLASVEAVTAIEALVAAVTTEGSDVSVAVREQLLPVSIVTPVNTATPAAAVATYVEVPSAQLDVMVIESVVPVVAGTSPDTSSTETLKVARGVPAVAVVAGNGLVNTS